MHPLKISEFHFDCEGGLQLDVIQEVEMSNEG